MKPFLTTKQFIEKAIAIHGNKYDYSKVVYLGMFIKVIIICPIHGEFEQLPLSHLQNKGCYFCGKKRRIDKILVSLEEYKKKAVAIHGDKYEYNEIILNSTRDNIVIKCLSHGNFIQRADKHIYDKAGCPKCAKEKLKKLLSLTKEEFVKKAIEIHGNKYSYDNFIYNNNKTKSKIKCNKCKTIFEQSPDSHINQKNGCLKCNSSKGESAIQFILDKHKIRYIREYKIPEIISQLYYDFYLPEFNLLIEFHGIQHYEYIPFLHDHEEDNFLKQKIRDDLIRNNARQFKYRYLEFNYKQLKYMTQEQFEEMIFNKISCG